MSDKDSIERMTFCKPVNNNIEHKENVNDITTINCDNDKV